MGGQGVQVTSEEKERARIYRLKLSRNENCEACVRDGREIKATKVVATRASYTPWDGLNFLVSLCSECAAKLSQEG